MAAKKPTRPRDSNQLAKSIVDLATDATNGPVIASSDLRSAAAELGRRGGLKGGKARAAKLTAQERSKIAKNAASVRWSKKSKK